MIVLNKDNLDKSDFISLSNFNGNLLKFLIVNFLIEK